ncbi:MAG: hypothetical protein ACJ74M_12760 [Gaiellaceae bacterium]|jgi:hypothetical protein
MSEEERFEAEEESDDVEAHRRRLNDEPAAKEEDESDDVEAHRRRA